MSWHYLREQEEDCWGPDCSGSIPSELARLIPTLDESFSRDSATGSSTASLYGTTSEPSTVDLGEVQFSLCPVVFPAKTSPRRVRVEDCPATVRASFSRCCELLRRHNLALSSRKTVRSCVPAGSASSSKSLTAWGIEAHGAFWELGTSARLIDETECGSYLPTPTASHYGTRNNGKRGDGSTFKTAGAPSLQTMARREGGRLSPAFTEAMMRWPIGWTDLKPLETDKYRRWLLSHGTF